MKIAKSFADYTRLQDYLWENIRQEEIRKIQEETNQMIEAQWRTREEEIRWETLEQINHQRCHLLQKESEWAEKIEQQEELS